MAKKNKKKNQLATFIKEGKSREYFGTQTHQDKSRRDLRDRIEKRESKEV